MIHTIIEVFSFIYMGSALLCGPFSKWPHFENNKNKKKKKKKKKHTILHCY